jgi:hypothetical protein
MNWLNIEIKTLTSNEFLGSEPVDRATWICLLRYCAQQENGGKIKDCKEWKNRQWMQLAGITCEEINRKTMLWKWEGDSVTVWEYPTCKEKEIKAKRKAGRITGKKNSSFSVSNSASSSASSSALEKGKERKGIGKEKEIKELFESCWISFGKYGNKQKALRYWKRLNNDDRDSIKTRIPIYLNYLRASGVSQKMFDGWINPENKIWKTTYENLNVSSSTPKQPETWGK